MPILKHTDTELSRIKFEGDKYQIEHYEAINPLALKGNYEARKDKKCVVSSDQRLGRLVARVPMLLYMQWQKQYPELRDSDKDYAHRFLMKLLDKTENEVFRTVDKL